MAGSKQSLAAGRVKIYPLLLFMKKLAGRVTENLDRATIPLTMEAIKDLA